MKQSKFLSLKEFVIVLLLACVETAIGLVVTTVSYTHLSFRSACFMNLYAAKSVDGPISELKNPIP